MNRRDEATQAVQLAQQCLDLASQEVDDMAKQLQDLEAALALAPVEAPTPT